MKENRCSVVDFHFTDLKISTYRICILFVNFLLGNCTWRTFGVVQPLHFKWALGLWVAEVLRPICLSITFDFSLGSQRSNLRWLCCYFSLAVAPVWELLQTKMLSCVLCSFCLGIEAQSLPALNHKLPHLELRTGCPYSPLPSGMADLLRGLLVFLGDCWHQCTSMLPHWNAGQGLEGTQVSNASVLGSQMHVQHELVFQKAWWREKRGSL